MGVRPTACKESTSLCNSVPPPGQTTLKTAVRLVAQRSGAQPAWSCDYEAAPSSRASWWNATPRRGSSTLSMRP